MEHVIEISHLTKDYGQGRGVFDVSFSVNQGECFGFLGPNGAGKSTTIRHLMGFSVPDSGATYLKGVNSLKDRSLIMQGVSYIPGEIALPGNLTGKEVIKEQMRLKHMDSSSRLDELTEYFDLDPRPYCRSMSLGTKRKIAIVCAFMNDPDVIIMDEPSSGLDPEMQEKFVSLVVKEKKEGKTILLSSHIFQEVDSCCDRIAVIKDGKIVSLFKADDLKHKVVKNYRVYYKSHKEAELQCKEMRKRHYDFHVSEKDPTRISGYVDEGKTAKFLQDISGTGYVDFSEKKQTLEDYFMSFYKEDKVYGGIKK